MIRHRVATVGRPGPAWPRAVARWGSGATLPLDTTTCVSADELRALVVDATVDLAIVEAGLPGVDRVLADDVRRAGTALAVVTPPTLTPAAERLDPDALLPADFDAQALAAVLQAHARTRAKPPPTAGPGPGPASEGSPELVAVTGPGGTGASTVAQALAAQRAGLGPVILADLALEGDQHLRHGVAPGHDGVFELAEALRHAPAAAIAVPIAPQPAGYDLLCGLRRRQEWTILCGSVAEHVLASLLPRRPDRRRHRRRPGRASGEWVARPGGAQRPGPGCGDPGVRGRGRGSMVHHRRAPTGPDAARPRSPRHTPRSTAPGPQPCAEATLRTGAGQAHRAQSPGGPRRRRLAVTHLPRS